MGRCFLCRRMGPVELHHLFGGALRGKSQRYGLVVELCPGCHREGPDAVHRSGETMRILHEYGQRKWMRERGGTAEAFRKEFYKNYL